MQRYVRWITEGIRLHVPPIPALASDVVSPQIKHRSRLHWWLAEQEVHQIDPRGSALLMDARGRLTETASANLLLVLPEGIRTPRRSGVLHGVSQRVVAELCQTLGLSFAEADLTLADVARAHEAMLTCTSYCLLPVARINDVPMSVPGAAFEQLHEAWSELVGLDIRKQILDVGMRSA
jgi:branched-subunit amino acid aminotransferase/4-amino-4-deoxychorismate lyase